MRKSRTTETPSSGPDHAGAPAESQARNVPAWIRKLQASVEHDQGLLSSDERITVQARIASLLARSTSCKDKDVETEMLATYRIFAKAMNRHDWGTPIKHDMPRLPTEIAVHWMAALEETVDSLPLNEQKTHGICQALLTNARRQWLNHDLKTADIQSALRDSATLLASVENPQSQRLAGLATSLDGELARYSGVSPPTTRLFDNVHGRVFESALIAYLVKHPPKEVVQSMQQLGAALSRSVNEAARYRHFAYGLTEIQKCLRHKNRFWTRHFARHNPDYHAFMMLDLPQRPKDDTLPSVSVNENPNVKRGKELLCRMLAAPVKDGVDCIARPYLTVILMNAFGVNGISFPGKRSADSNYRNVIHRAAGRRSPDSSSKQTRLVSKWASPTLVAGTTLAYQWPAALAPANSFATTRPALRNRPIFPDSERSSQLPGIKDRVKQIVKGWLTDKPKQSVETTVALQNGIPYVSGSSGSTNLILHHISAINKNPQTTPIDVNHAMLGTMMFLNYDGGHSMHEVLWTVNQFKSINRSESARTNGTGPRPSQFKSDYAKYIDQFGNSSPTRNALEKATQYAFDVMLLSRRVYVDNAPLRSTT
ncbi:hypothetical protein DFQ30_010894 [Apophysomyces sp. BC1015]|nr:hypothetical protein DFQ30_010894 [Apophysomyces sp. BC1015]